ncbi:MAG: LysR family transcriptional regulator [Actinomycetota bacterium]|nr:LysR family transcriptional regulator [Actinomycetota bacterium]
MQSAVSAAIAALEKDLKVTLFERNAQRVVLTEAGEAIKGGMPISGLFDLRPFRYSWLQPKLLLTHEVIEQQSPLFHIPRQGSLPPMLVTLGGDESAEFHRQSAAFVEAWRASGADARTFDQPGKDHITAIAGFEDPESELCHAVIDFMRHATP